MSKSRITVLVLLFTSILFLTTGCQQNPETVIFSRDSATQTKLIKFKTKNATYLATQWSEQKDGSRAAALAGDDPADGGQTSDDVATVKTTDSLVAVVQDENGDQSVQNVMELPKELKLASWCTPQPVREVYKCPYPTIEYEAKGFYTVFACPIDWWCYEDGSPAPHVGQVMYVKPDGTVVDILNFENDVRRYAATWIKENDGEEYIQFDDNGNIFILTHDDSVGKTVVYRYNPMNDKIDGYTLNVQGDVDIRNFRITRDGKWIFLNVMLRHQQNNVYALQVNSTARPITMYEFNGEVPETGKDPQWAVSSIEINPTTNEVYWYVATYLDDTRAESGLYVASRSTNGEYSARKVKRFYSTPSWCLGNAATKFIRGRNVGEPDYEGFLDYLKSICNCDKNDVVFTLAYFKDRWEEYREWSGEEDGKKDFSPLYAEDENGEPLTDIEALQYLFSNTVVDYYDGIAGETKDLFSLLEKYYDECWRVAPYEDGIKRSGKGICLNEGYKNETAFPWEKVLINKNTGEPAVEVTFNKGYYSENDSGIILANDEGVWVLSDVWDGNADDGRGANIYSHVFRITDEKGNFLLEQPGDILSQEFCTRDSCRRKSDTDPWFKQPFNANTTGIAALSKDKKTVYFHKEGVTKDLLANDLNKTRIERIYSFSLEEDQLIYNAKVSDGSYIMVSIDLDDTNHVNLLPLTKQVESMLGMWSE